VLGQFQHCRAGGREFQILIDVTEKLRAPNTVHCKPNGEQIGIGGILGNKQECEKVYYWLIRAGEKVEITAVVTMW